MFPSSCSVVSGLVRAVFVGALIAGVQTAAAQTKAAQTNSESGGFVVRLGSDTVALERFTRTGGVLEGEVLARTPNTRRIRYRAALAPDGTISRFEASAVPLAAGVPIIRPIELVVLVDRDTASVDIRLADSTIKQRVATMPGVVPLASYSFAGFEQAVRQFSKAGTDSVPVQLLFPGANEPYSSAVTRRGRDSVVIAFFGDPLSVRADSTGRILGADGRATTMKVLVERVRAVDLDRLGAAFATRDAAGNGLGPLSARDTVDANVGSARLTVDYGRPRKRGRAVFGNVVPWGKVWRTGANAATHFTTDRDLMIGGKAIPAGTYTLWTLPSRSGVKLIINKQTNQWGTDYDAGQDLARVDLRTEILPAPIEVFTIATEPAETGSLLRLEWDRTRWAVPLAVR